MVELRGGVPQGRVFGPFFSENLFQELLVFSSGSDYFEIVDAFC